ncbi:MAG: PGF-pre-PGF domain-containing protein, partial [Candidatus Hadarchaeaceae archaeon]
WQIVEAADGSSAIWSFKIDLTAPTATALISPADGAYENVATVTLDWDAASDAIGIENYKVFVDGGLVYTETDNSITSYDYTFTEGEHTWYIVAVDYVGRENVSVTRTIKIDLTAPTAPTLLAPENNTTVATNTPVFRWAKPEAFENYTLQIANDVGFTLLVLAKTNLTDNAYTLTTGEALADGTYYWRVRAFDQAGNVGRWAENFKLIVQVGPGPSLPSSSVDTISPYWRTAVPFTITATASGTVNNVTLYYRYSSNNSSWDSWTSFGVDTASPWEWSFTADSGDGYYEFYSIAAGSEGQESVPAEADARCGVDTAAPVITSVLINGGDDSTSSSSVTLSINASDATSGLAEMQYSNDDLSWSNWESFTASKSYTLPAGGGLKTVYVRVKDEAGLVSAIVSDSITLETVPPPLEGALTVTIGTIKAGETGSADFTRYEISVTEIRITTTSDVSGVRVDVVMHTAKPAGVTAIDLPVYSYFDLSTTVDSAYISGATIKFKVSKSWVAEKNIDERTIRLLRYSNGWQMLPTEMIRSDSTYFHYEATTSGFWMFAIVGEPMVAPTSTPPAAPIVSTLTQSPPFLYAVLFMVVGVFGLAMVYRLAKPSRYYIMLKRLKQLERELVKPVVRHIGLPLPKSPVVMPRRVSLAELAALRRLERIGLEKLLRNRRS